MLLVACAPAVNPAIVTAAPVEPVTIKLVLLPILDTLPMYVAQKEGLFAAKGVKVEFIPVGSAAERDQVIAAGQADGMINEVVSTILYNKEKIQVQIVRFARVSTNDVPMYRIIAAKDSGISDPAGLKGLEIGISQGTVIEYMTDRLLESEGLLPDEIKTIAVPKIPDRMALLSTGELKAAMLPDPFSFLAVQQGGTILLEDSKFPQYGYSTIAFRKETIEAQPAAIKAFLSAIEDATARINSNPEQYESLLSEQKLVPASLQGAYKIGPYPTASVPNEEQWNDVLAWAKKKGLVSVDVTYADSVNMSLLP
jgi:NitT/TauT family transport system substrate-binding protein